MMLKKKIDHKIYYYYMYIYNQLINNNLVSLKWKTIKGFYNIVL